MKTTISLSTPAQLETESLVAIVLDHTDQAQKDKNKDAKPQLKLATGDAAAQSAAADLLAGGELTGKPFENQFAPPPKPAGLKAKRLLLIGGGAAKSFPASYDLRRIAGSGRAHAEGARHPELRLRRSAKYSCRRSGERDR